MGTNDTLRCRLCRATKKGRPQFYTPDETRLPPRAECELQDAVPAPAQQFDNLLLQRMEDRLIPFGRLACCAMNPNMAQGDRAIGHSDRIVCGKGPSVQMLDGPTPRRGRPLLQAVEPSI